MNLYGRHFIHEINVGGIALIEDGTPHIFYACIYVYGIIAIWLAACKYFYFTAVNGVGNIGLVANSCQPGKVLPNSNGVAKLYGRILLCIVYCCYVKHLKIAC